MPINRCAGRPPTSYTVALLTNLLERDIINDEGASVVAGQDM